MNDIVLHYAPDNASLIVRIILEESQLPYRAVLVNRSKQEQRGESYLKLNPTGLIPVCVIDGMAITETAAIALYICEQNTAADSGLCIALNHPARAQFLRNLFFLANTIHSDLRQLFYADQYAGDNEQQQSLCRQLTRDRLNRNIGLLEIQFAESETTYLFGAEPSIVDVYLAVCLRWMQLYPANNKHLLKVSRFPVICEMLAVLQGREAVVSACAKEGISGDFFTAAQYAKPVEGSAV